MARRVQDQKPPRKPEAQVWFKANVAEQKKRHAAIAREMDGLGKDREKWVAEFLRIIQTKGFNFNGDQRAVIPAKDIPKKPKGRHRVVF